MITVKSPEECVHDDVMNALKSVLETITKESQPLNGFFIIVTRKDESFLVFRNHGTSMPRVVGAVYMGLQSWCYDLDEEPYG